ASIPSPNTEPVIGVIDTLFDNRVYFSEWVEYKDMVSADIPKKQSDYEHGTAVSSIIVDGPTFNPELDDGCGRFRVRHFGVATGGSFSSFSILRAIKEIVAANKDIKVWNLSLGSQLEINENFISPEAAILDSIQAENDIIFIIAGTNKIDPKSKNVLIGAPADSINSLVVNAVTPKNLPTDYSRRGPVLSFFMKPDVSYYGGTDDNRIRVCTPTGEKLVQGTSFAAPWIARKMAYLIHVAGLTREVAKALIIDAATGWKKETDTTEYIGHGVVPVKINDIVQSPKDEIKFFLSGKSEKYDTYNYNIPVPISNEKHPFIAKATLCYFPACSRNQGVDYTNTELDILFGRIGNDNAIKPINNNYQSEVGHFMYEKEARKYYRKWDNIKHIRETENKNKPKKIYTGMWGISIKTKERLEQKFGEDLKFGVVITLKAIDGVNRIEDFIQQCSLRGWLVNRINIENKIDIYNAAEAHVDFS
ncbi:MAG: S8 family peptidase, partial [Alphaproteobacteria bacterium]|nr:S8 family peptidase [Alphaproteobacteria bacterium]